MSHPPSDRKIPERRTHRARIWGASLVLHALALAALIWWSQGATDEPEPLIYAQLSHANFEPDVANEWLPDLEPEPEQLPAVTITDTPYVVEETELFDQESEPTPVEAQEPMPLLSSVAFDKPRTEAPEVTQVLDAPPTPVVARPRPPVVRRPAPRRAKSGGTLRLVSRPNVAQFYPLEARQRNVQGEALLVIEVDRTGSVVRAWVRQSSGYRILDDAALRVAYAHQFAPGTQGQAELPVRFRLIG